MKKKYNTRLALGIEDTIATRWDGDIEVIKDILAMKKALQEAGGLILPIPKIYEKDVNELKTKARSLIDSEYDVISNFTKSDLFDYLASLFPTMTKALSDEIHEEMF